jgi:hypothetical protein
VGGQAFIRQKGDRALFDEVAHHRLGEGDLGLDVGRLGPTSDGLATA